MLLYHSDDWTSHIWAKLPRMMTLLRYRHCMFEHWPPPNRCPNVGRPIEEGEAQATAAGITLIPYLASPYSLKKSRGSTLVEFLFEPMLVNSTPEACNLDSL